VSDVPEAELPADRKALWLIDPQSRQVTPLGIGHPLHTGLRLALHPSDEWLAMTTRMPLRPTDADQPKAHANELRVYHLPSRQLAGRIQFPINGFSPFWVGFTPDGTKLVAIERLGTIQVWDFVPATGP
jgi:hypothetical protein